MRKTGDNSVIDFELLPKDNQVIYPKDTTFESNITSLAKVVLDIFCSQAYIGLY